MYCSGLVRWWIVFDIICTLSLPYFQHHGFQSFGLWHPPHGLYLKLWRVDMPIWLLVGAVIVLRRRTAYQWPIYAIGSLALFGWAARYPDQWPGTLVQLEIHLLAFVCTLLGGYSIGAQQYALAALFMVTAAGLYPSPWHDIRLELMLAQAACYLAIAFGSRATVLS